jgi:hypothetical protein
MDAGMLAPARIFVGLLQGFALYALYQSYSVESWPATEGMLFAALATCAALVPTIVIGGLGNLRVRTLLAWSAAALTICAVLGTYDIYREPIAGSASTLRNIPSVWLWLALPPTLFILNALVTAGDADRKCIAGYSTYFDIAWKHGVQVVLAAAFVGVFWGLLLLGSALFALINITVLSQLIQKSWFSIPVTALAAATVIHVTDVRASLVAGARTLTLLLLSWLLPMMAVFAIVFVFALPLTGLDPLWRTKNATSILLSSAAALVFLINAAYHDGKTPVAVFLPYARWAAALLLTPLVAIAGYALWLRIGQHGLTPERIIAAACFLIGACYAAGYAYAAIRSRLALKQLEITNVLSAWVIIGIVVLIFSPVLDPARLSVADQLRRLNAGTVTPERFDFRFLGFEAGRYGREALRDLAENARGPRANTIADFARRTLAARNKYQAPANGVVQEMPPTPEIRASNIGSVFPAGKSIPDSLLAKDWNAKNAPVYYLPPCLTTSGKCDAVLVDLDSDGKDEVILLQQPAGAIAVFRLNGTDWAFVGTLTNNRHCPGVRGELSAGRFKIVEPEFSDIEIGGNRLRLMELQPRCMPLVKQ